MSSRLDRLICLLETGSTSHVKRTAAEQIGSIVKSYPEDLYFILDKVLVYLKSKSWDIRIAASQVTALFFFNKAIGSISKNTPLWNPVFIEGSIQSNISIPSDILTFDKIQINTILSNGALLLSSQGNEYDLDLSHLDPKERLQILKKQINQKLGIGTQFMDLDLNENDISNIKKEPEIVHKPATEIINVPTQLPDENLSARERLRLKRKAKLASKSISHSIDYTAKRVKTESSQNNETTVIANAPKDTENIPYSMPSSDEWLFESVCEILAMDLFSHSWEVRHGATIGLREILRVHGSECGKVIGATNDMNDTLHQSWLNDIAIRLICLLGLDRFSDYVSDQVIAPVRESCGQTLAIVLQNLSPKSCIDLLQNGILKLIYYQSNSWEVRFSGLIGLKYFLAVRKDLFNEIFSLKESSPVFKAIVSGLEDANDDIRAVCSLSLCPVVNELLAILNPQIVYDSIVLKLFGSLKDLDDLSTATAPIMDLLTQFLLDSSINKIMSSKMNSLQSFIPDIFPFFRHAISSVRISVLKTLLTLAKTTLDCTWISEDLLHLIFQNFFFEESLEILELSFGVWITIIEKIQNSNHIQMILDSKLDDLLGLLMTPIRIPLSETYLYSSSGFNKIALYDKPLANQEYIISESYIYIGRFFAARALGQLYAYGKETIDHLFNRYSNSLISYQQVMLCEIIVEAKPLDSKIYDSILSSLMIWDEGKSTPLQDMIHPLSELKHQLLLISNQLKQRVNEMPPIPTVHGSTQQQVSSPLGPFFNLQIAQLILKNYLTTHPDLFKSFESSILIATKKMSLIEARVYSSFSCVIINYKKLPQKLNLIIHPLMTCLKNDPDESFQKRAAISISNLIDLNINLGKESTNSKLIKNILTQLCSGILEDLFTDDEQIYSLLKNKVKIKKPKTRKSSSIIDESISNDLIKESELEIDPNVESCHKIMQRGAEYVFEQLSLLFGDSIFIKCPKLWESIEIVETFSQKSTEKIETESLQTIIETIHIIGAITKYLSHGSRLKIIQIILNICSYLKSKHSLLRYHASVCLASLTSIIPDETIQAIIHNVIPLANDVENTMYRKGAMECFHNLVNAVEDKILPYIIFLIIPILRRISDPDEQIRQISTHIFAQLIKLIPLESGIPDPIGIPKELVIQREEERKFLGQLVGTEKVQPFELPVTINADLRTYQKEGVNWLAFLNRYGLHGILCDDMGLGKTIQTICIVAADHFWRRNSETEKVIPSLVVCPSILCQHWESEITKFAPFLSVMSCIGTPTDRKKSRISLNNVDVFITSYESLRADITDYQSTTFNYIILDEGHLIRNSKNKLSKAVKSIKGIKRLILSGTPIQNNALELWSLFDFLMPGFLGTEQMFQERYGKPITASKHAKSNSREQEQGALALEALHRQVLPFILRRMKEDVLDDLPPKIIQDYYCDMSLLQTMMYSSFSSRVNLSVKGGVFQSLSYLRKLVNHPALVHNPSDPLYEAVENHLSVHKTTIMSIENAPKLLALQQLLNGLGIGRHETDYEQEEQVVSPHRVLIFCQLKDMIDIIENQFFKKMNPSITYLRLDGSVPQDKRHPIIEKFNRDPSIDVLLLTTSVGGLGLNLTSADTVIFYEHDWNPQKDLQAMDRAHRIGQKRTVNVYRLITKDTLEEKIMGLQKFKLHIAASLINQDNSGINGMNSEEILDLFHVGKSDKEEKEKKEKVGVNGLEVDALWSFNEYDDLEMNDFLKKLNQ